MQNKNEEQVKKFYFLDCKKNKELENILNTFMIFEKKCKFEVGEKFTYKYKKSGFVVEENNFSKVNNFIIKFINK